MGIPLY